MDGAAMPAAAIAGAAGAAATYLRMAAADAVLARAAGAALALAEAFCGQWLIVRETEEVVAGTRGWQRLAVVPVRSIVAPAGDLAVDITADGIGWVRGAGAVTVRYSAGVAATWEALPAPVAQGVVLLAAHLFEHREGGASPPAAVAALWRPYRRMRLSPEVRT
ncbi:phage gp6-like head-tail connector protein [Sphingomonas sp. RP10(2022)]|uniref:Phage gp6-like head-tail connector protein n=1 Tax=Sphingomonas liriopis TaxID=2949094 RepID=A0A9X2KQJ5_9SPHN|nr:head-tail connector protein [Sphingomonas liriopis]MCP3735040.1 phage gp6-like head-tail connector protein [Sphingomonas liriopis]